MNNMNNMNILILGKGSRENVIKEKLEIYKNNYDKIFIINDEDFTNIYNFCIFYIFYIFCLYDSKHKLYYYNKLNIF